jgi:hypothetical protein
MSAQGKANGNRENSSTTVSMYFFLDDDGKGPLKSILVALETYKILVSTPHKLYTI